MTEFEQIAHALNVIDAANDSLQAKMNAGSADLHYGTVYALIADARSMRTSLRTAVMSRKDSLATILSNGDNNQPTTDLADSGACVRSEVRAEVAQ